MTRRSIPGPFTARELGGGAWQLTARAPLGAVVYLRGVEPRAAEVFADPAFAQLELIWEGAAVGVILTRRTGGTRLTVRTAIVHEARDPLYDALPLAAFDADAQRFWRRIFRLMAIPGGRLLLRFAARRRR